MQRKYIFLEYLSVTAFVWSLYLIWLVPFQLYWVQMPWDMFMNWLISGTIAEFIIAYPIAKAIVKYVPKITKYWMMK